jgi:hypothetical protein
MSSPPGAANATDGIDISATPPEIMSTIGRATADCQMNMAVAGKTISPSLVSTTMGANTHAMANSEAAHTSIATAGGASLQK